MNPIDPLAAALHSLTPAPVALNRDRLLFEAGRAAGSRTVRRWRSVAVGGGFAALGLAIVLASQPHPHTQVALPVVPLVMPTPLVLAANAAESTSSEERLRWLQLRDAVLANGVDELPPAPPGMAVPDNAALRRLPLLD
jgi:hypothetical protein